MSIKYAISVLLLLHSWRISCLRSDLADHGLGAVYWREEDPSARKILEGESSRLAPYVFSIQKKKNNGNACYVG